MTTAAGSLPTGGHADDLVHLRTQITELLDALEAIRGGGIDAVITGPPGQETVYTLASADRPYRVILEEMNEGALTVSRHGVVLFINATFARLVGRRSETIVGTSLADIVVPDDRPTLDALLGLGPGEHGRAEVSLIGTDRSVPVLLAAGGLAIEDATMVCIVATDLTSQKEIEAALRHSEQQLDARARDLELLNSRLEDIISERTSELTTAIRELERQAAARLQWARDVNDTIVQTLVAAETTADLGRADECRELLHLATRSVRDRVTELVMEGGPLVPGSLVRGRTPERRPPQPPAATS